MQYLAIDTCGQEVRVAHLDASGLLREERRVSDREHAELVHTLLRDVLGRDTLSQIGGIVLLEGPGAFTSVRIGVSVGNALAYALKAKLYGVDMYTLLKTAGTSHPFYFSAGKEMYELIGERKAILIEGKHDETVRPDFTKCVSQLITSGEIKRFEKTLFDAYYIKEANISVSKNEF